MASIIGFVCVCARAERGVAMILNHAAFLCVITRHVICAGGRGGVECFSTRSESPGRQAGAAELHVPQKGGGWQGAALAQQSYSICYSMRYNCSRRAVCAPA
jgi:hypothetical protein